MERTGAKIGMQTDFSHFKTSENVEMSKNTRSVLVYWFRNR